MNRRLLTFLAVMLTSAISARAGQAPSPPPPIAQVSAPQAEAPGDEQLERRTMAAVRLSDDESGEWNRIQLAEGRFETRLFRVVPELQFSPWLSLVNNIQYDSVSAELGCVHSELAARSAPQSLLDARSTGCVEAALHPAVLRRTLNTIGQRVVFL